MSTSVRWGIGTRTHCALAPSNEVVRQSFIRLGTACRRKAHMVVKQAWRYDEASLGMRGRRMKRLVAAHRTSEQSADGCMTALPLRLTARRHSGSAYLSAQRIEVDTPAVGPLRRNKAWSPPNTACPIAAFFGYFLCSSKESDCRPAQGRS